MRRATYAILAIALILNAAFHTAGRVAESAQTHVEAVLRVLRNDVLHHERIDWTRVWSDTLARVRTARSPMGTYAAIWRSLDASGDVQETPVSTPSVPAVKQPVASKSARKQPSRPRKHSTAPVPAPVVEASLPVWSVDPLAHVGVSVPTAGWPPVPLRPRFVLLIAPCPITRATSPSTSDSAARGPESCEADKAFRPRRPHRPSA